MTESEYQDYIKSSKTHVKENDTYTPFMKKFLKQMFERIPPKGGAPKDPFSAFKNLKELLDYLELFESSYSDFLTKKISEANGKGHATLTHYINILKSSNPSDSGNSDVVFDQLTKMKKNHNKRHEISSKPSPASYSTSSKTPTSAPLIHPEISLIDELKTLLENTYNIILHGAPGTGKTYLAKKVAEAINNDENPRMVQFHPSYDYTDFMEGLRPVKSGESIAFERKDGVFKQLCSKAVKEDPKKKHVFIIDEINRGEISKIFGECMFCIDPGYIGSEHMIETQYQNLVKDDDIFAKGFYRPKNVYIIGTMNDIDRGVESMDLAMRRRFIFKEISAEDTMDEILSDIEEKEKAKNAMSALNQIIRDTPELGEDYCIGAAYFRKIMSYIDDNKWDLLWKYNLKGLIKEYIRGIEDKTVLSRLEVAYFDAVK